MPDGLNELRSVWIELRYGQRGCSFEDDYRLLRCLVTTTVIKAQG